MEGWPQNQHDALCSALPPWAGSICIMERLGVIQFQGRPTAVRLSGPLHEGDISLLMARSPLSTFHSKRSQMCLKCSGAQFLYSISEFYLRMAKRSLSLWRSAMCWPKHWNILLTWNGYQNVKPFFFQLAAQKNFTIKIDIGTALSCGSFKTRNALMSNVAVTNWQTVCDEV